MPKQKTSLVDQLGQTAVAETKSKAPPEGITREVDNDNHIVTAVSRTIRTVDDAVKAAKIDLDVWEITRHVINKWDCVARVSNSGDWRKRLAATELWQVKLWCSRKVPKLVEDGCAALVKRMQKFSPKYTPIKREKISDPHMLEISLCDAHLGKLCWSKETGSDNFDLAIAESLYESVVRNLVAKASGFNIDKILLPVGNDFFHVDGLAGLTANGTPQDVDGRFVKMFETGQMAVTKAVDYLRKIAPVEVVWVGGNHDRISSWHVVHTLKAWFRNSADVTINDEPTHRKYVKYGASLIGFTHGDEEKHSSLPAIMAVERPELWATSRYREWHLGHWHRRKQTQYVSVDSHEGVSIKILPSISSADAWHARKGYIGNRAADAYLYSKENGPAGNFIANVVGERKVA